VCPLNIHQNQQTGIRSRKGRGRARRDRAGVAREQGPRVAAGVLALAEEYHGGDDVGLVGGFAVGVVAVAVEDAVGHFAGLAGDAGDVGGQAVHVQGFAALGELHLFFGAFPVQELGVVGQALLLEVLEAAWSPLCRRGTRFCMTS
jgi:hypothetical protein